MFSVRDHAVRSLRWWYSHRREIDLDPPYQRKGKIWSAVDKAYLIDSILNGYDVPKIYMADFTISNTPLNTERLPYAIIDGRQRFEAIFDFFEDRVALNEDFEADFDSSLQLAGLRYSDLRKNYPDVLERFEEFNLHVMSVITDDPTMINELFVRLNRSKPLTGAEIRNAMAGAVPMAIRRITEHAFFNEYIKFSTLRGQDKNTAAKLLLIEFRGKFVDVKRVQLDRFVEEGIASETDEFGIAADRVTSVLNRMIAVFVRKDPLLSSQGLVPVYYWLVREFGALDSLREFLIRFERSRKANSELAGTKPEAADQELLAFDLLNRNTNDQKSLRGRFEILQRRYLAFLSEDQ
jgi:hypothetical protein